MGLHRKEWLIVLAPLLATWSVDRVTKMWAEGSKGLFWYGPFGTVLHHNHGAMLGLFSDLPASLRIVSLATGGAFLIFTFGIIQYLLPIKSLLLRTGMAVLLGGILGNVTDRILYGYVVDFLLIGSPTRTSPAFNMADALQWVGYFMIGMALVRDGEVLWPADNVRKKLWVNAKFQLRYCLVLVGIGIGFSLIAGVFSYTFMRVTIIDLVGQNDRLIAHYLNPFIFTYTLVSLVFSGSLFLVGRMLSARIAGPLYAFEKWLGDLVSGKFRPLRLRAGDEFRHLEMTAARLSGQMVLNIPPGEDKTSEQNESDVEDGDFGDEDRTDSTAQPADASQGIPPVKN
jgi:signal peptidase II